LKMSASLPSQGKPPRQVRPASQPRLSAAGEGVFTDGGGDPQEVFERKMTISGKTLSSCCFKIFY
ncbi:hypothetical protein, partial [Celeribacter indicus]|uniref:hypothetical protein n=1 Tax=Celeribacter indicus TaxID=1208324 RepID=UPI001C31A487